MEFMNSTYHAAATFLPQALPMSPIGKTTDFSPAMIKLDPWTIFDKAWTTTFGWSAEDFDFVPGTTPMATLRETATWISLYYVVIFGGREIMRNRPAFKLQQLFLAHNFFLTMLSGGLLVLFIQQLIPALWNNGVYSCICTSSGWTKPLLILYYLNYLTKYYELLDTVFLVLKKKPLTFLHTYHHGATALLCYTQLVGKTPVSWVPITLNLTVHVVMYWYYFQSARGVKVWWKQYITMLQISQFVLDLGFIYFATYNFFVDAYWPSLPHSGKCGDGGDSAQELAAGTGCAIISSYLVLFIMFYFSTYKKPSAKKALRRASKVEVPNATETKDLAVAGLESLEKVASSVVETVEEKSEQMKI